MCGYDNKYQVPKKGEQCKCDVCQKNNKEAREKHEADIAILNQHARSK